MPICGHFRTSCYFNFSTKTVCDGLNDFAYVIQASIVDVDRFGLVVQSFARETERKKGKERKKERERDRKRE